MAQRVLAPFAGLFLGAAPTVAEGQPPPPVGPGARVRIWHTDRCCASPQIGALVSIGRDSVVVSPGGSPTATRVTLARASVRDLQLGYDAGSHLWTGVKIGALAGAITGGTAGLTHDCGGDEYCDGFRPLFVVSGAVAFGLLGTLVGAIVGASVRREDWVPIPIPAEVGLAPDPGGGLGVRFAFRP